MAKKDPTIRVFQAKGREFLYQDWNKSPTLSEKEIEEAFRSVMRGEENEVENAPAGRCNSYDGKRNRKH